MEERTGWRGQNESQIIEGKRNGRLVGAAETSKERAEWRRLQRKNLSILGLLKRKEWSQCHSVGKNVGAALAKRKKNRLSKAPDHEGERVKMGESRTLARVRGIRARALSGKGGVHSEQGQIPMRTGEASKKSLPRTSRRKRERVSGRKSSPGRSAESWFHSKCLAKPEIGKEVGRRRARS